MSKKKSDIKKQLDTQWEAGLRNKYKLVLFGSKEYFEALQKALKQNKDE